MESTTVKQPSDVSSRFSTHTTGVAQLQARKARVRLAASRIQHVDLTVSTADNFLAVYTPPDSVADEARSSHQDQSGRVGPGVLDLSLEMFVTRNLDWTQRKRCSIGNFATFSPVPLTFAHGMRQYGWSCAKHSRTGSMFQEVWQRSKLEARTATHVCQWSSEDTSHGSSPLPGFEE